MKIGLFPTDIDSKYPFYKQELIFAKSFIQLSDYYEHFDFTIYPHYQVKKNRDKWTWAPEPWTHSELSTALVLLALARILKKKLP